MSQPDPGASAPQPRAALGGDIIIPALGFGLTAYYLASTVDLVWEAKATGIVIGLVLLALCIAHFVRIGLRLASGQGEFKLGDLIKDDAFNRQRLALLAMVAIYVLTIYWVGATIGLFFLLIACMRLLGVTRLRTLVGTAFLSAAVVHLALITLLDSKLPHGLILSWLAKALGGGAA